MRHRLDRLVLLTLLLGSEPAAVLGGEPAANDPSGNVIVGRGFAFRAPEGEAWEVQRNEDGRLVTLSHLGTGRALTLLGERHAKTILVYRDVVLGAPEGVTPAEVAADLFLKEEQTMRSEGVAAREYTLAKIEKGVLERSGKTIHFMRYVATFPSLAKNRAILCLWFPESFASTRNFYAVHYSQFVVSDSVGMMRKFNPEPALRVLDTLEERPEESP